MRVAIGAFLQETNSFCPLPTTLEAFEGRYLVRGAELLPRFHGTNSEIAGFQAACAAIPRTELVPLLAASADSGGSLTADTYALLRDELIERLAAAHSAAPVDVVLLAGLPSKLAYIQELVQMYVPLAPSRIVPMHNHYAGNWYPYQDEKGHNPGVIVDPKSPVVVGAAVEFMARHGMLPQFRFEMKGRIFDNSYYWGVMTDATSGIRNERILFQPVEDQAREEITEFTTSSQRVLIGRKLAAGELAQATPVYLLKMDVGDRIGQTEVVVKIKRKHASKEEEEILEVESVTGVVAGEDAILGENVTFSWRTLADERYYLDTGGLDNIELGPAR